MTDIVITVGSAYGSALALIRAIKKEIACKAYVLCTNKQTAEIIASSRYVDEVHLIDAKSEQYYIKQARTWYLSKSFDEKPILYFTYDISCYYIDNSRQWFEENFILCLPSSEIIQTYTQKGLAEKAAEQAGLTVPKTQTINSCNDIDIVINSFSFPVIVKPRAAYLKGDINFKIKVLDNKNEFKDDTEQIIANGNSLLCQEFIPGGNDTAWYYLFYRDSGGHIYNSMGKKTLQSSANGGIMLKGRSEYNEELSKICQSFLSTIDYKGIGGIEFKYHNGKYYFIEMSTRLEGFHQITESSGMPLSLISYHDLSKSIDHNASNKLTMIDNIKYIDLISAMLYRIKNKQPRLLLSDIYHSIFKSQIKTNIYFKGDNKPFYKELASIITRSLQKVYIFVSNKIKK